MDQQGPARKTPEALMDDMRAMVASNIAGNVQLLTRVGALLSHATQAAASAPGRTPDPAAVLAHGLDAVLASSAIVNTHTMAMLNELVDVAERTLVLPESPVVERADATDLREPADLRLEGERGASATGSFAVDNEYGSPVQVSFTVGTLVPGKGPSIPAARVRLDPVRAVIAANSSIEVAVSVEITEEFIIGETYTAVIGVAGFQARDVRLRVSVVKRDLALVAAKPVAKKRRRRAATRRNG